MRKSNERSRRNRRAKEIAGALVFCTCMAGIFGLIAKFDNDNLDKQFNSAEYRQCYENWKSNEDSKKRLEAKAEYEREEKNEEKDKSEVVETREGKEVKNLPAKDGIEKVKQIEVTSEFKGIKYSCDIDSSSKTGEIVSYGVIDDYGIYSLNNRILIVLSDKYGFNIKDNVIITLANGNILSCTVADVKKDTGNVFDIICEKDSIPGLVSVEGDFSQMSGFEGEIDSVTKE